MGLKKLGGSQVLARLVCRIACGYTIYNVVAEATKRQFGKRRRRVAELHNLSTPPEDRMDT